MNAYAGVPFQNSIEGGGNIIIPFLQSPNFIPGVSGWRISRNGDAEFASQTLRGPLIVIDPLTGLVVASIGQTGTIAGQFLTIENDIILAGQSLGDRLQDGRGLVGFKGFNANNNPPAPGAAAGGNGGVYSDTAWFRFPAIGGRLYQVFSTTMTLANNSATTEEFQTRWMASDSNVVPPAPVAISSYKDHCDNFMSYQAPSVLLAIGSDPLVTATMTMQLQSRQVTDGNNLTFQNTDGWNIFALDVGPLSGAMNDGGTGTVTGAQQLTKIYPATLSQSYNGSGNQIVSTDLWRSNFGDGNGATTSLCIFDGAQIRADLASAISIQSATLTMFCTTAEESNGSIAFDPDTQTSIPATQASFTGGDYPFDDDWPVPGWFSVNILGDFLDDILPAPTGISANAMKISSSITGGAATRFAGASVANRPYITVTYTVP